MLFNSIDFIIFFPIVVILYFSLSYRYRWALLLVASYYFYMCWKAEYIILIVASTSIDYFAGRMMGRTKVKTKRRKYLILSILSNLGLLFGFKYFNFFNDSLRNVFDSLNIFYGVPAFNLLLPVGISFYTFQTLSYSIEVYRGKKEPEKHFGIFALYVSFFPQLVAGPIERPQSLMPQFYEKHDFDYEQVTNGLKLMLWGFFKKIVIADRLALYVNEVYNNPYDQSGLSILLATYFFAFQIYCDFSGYSDIAIGAARVMGYRLMKNFDRPYFSKSISEFWRRWHISLSTWFRDYLYFPLGGNRVSKNRWKLNIAVVFLLSGLWHGADWTFVIWGGLHGAYMIFSNLSKELREKFVELLSFKKYPSLYKFFKVFLTFHLVLFSWIFFRANSISDAFVLINRMLHLKIDIAEIYALKLSLTWYEISIAVVSILLMETIHLIQRKYSIYRLLSFRPVWFRWLVYCVLLFGILMLGQFKETEFIYFQF